SRKPKVTFTLFSHPPDEGRLFIQPGNMANNEKGTASAVEKPNIPAAGPSSSPIVAAWTSKVPMIGPVQENDTTASVAAIKKRPMRPPLSALASILFTHEAGSVSSNAPRHETANATSRKKNSRLKTPLVERLFSASAPKATVIRSPRAT